MWWLLGVGGLLLALQWEPAAADYGLSLVKNCGEKVCSRYQYCSDKMCHECSNICNEEQHNFDPNICEKNCQDYIHDEVRHYLTEADSLKATKELQETLESMRILVAVSLFLSCLIILVGGLVAFMSWVNRRKLTSLMDPVMLDKKISTVSAICNNNDASNDHGKEKSLRIEIPEPRPSLAAERSNQNHSPSAVGAPSVATTTTPVSTRHPSEDATLEYAYDNHGLTPSPVQRHETTF